MTQSPLLGFNNNVKHRGKLFHIQTEDSGIRHPHVITHLFMDGGRILKTIKTSYAEHLGSDKLQQVVRDLMKEQHKMMFIALRDGQFDHALDSVPPPSMSGPPVHPHGAPSAARASETASLPPNSVVSTAPPTAPLGSAAVRMPPAQAPAKPAALQPVASAVVPSKTPSTTMPVVQQPKAVAPAGNAPGPGAPATTSPPVRPPSGTMPAASMPVEAAAAQGPPSSSIRPQAPAGASTGVRPVPRREAPDFFGTPAAEGSVANVVAEPPVAAAAAAAASGTKPKEQPGSGRYAASRPAAIFSSGRNADAGGSIFGDDLISEKSLDEVILSYLSDDLETPKK
jgi:hypothetical protein